MHLPDAKDHAFRSPQLYIAFDVARLVQFHGNSRCDTAHRLSPADDRSYAFLIDPVLQGDAKTVLGQVVFNHVGCPYCVVGFHSDENEIEGSAVSGLLKIRDMDRVDGLGEALGLCDAIQGEAVRPHVFDVFGPCVDQGHVMAFSGQVRANVAAEGPRADDSDLIRFLYHECLCLKGFVTTNSDTMHAAALAGIVGHGVMLDAPVVPKCQGPRFPSESTGEFGVHRMLP